MVAKDIRVVCEWFTEVLGELMSEKVKEWIVPRSSDMVISYAALLAQDFYNICIRGIYNLLYHI